MPARKGGHEIFAEIGKTGLTNAAMRGIIYLAFAGVAHLVERDLAKVEVASSSLVARSKKKHHPPGWCFLFGMPRAGWNTLPRPARSASNPEVKAGLLRMALPFVGCREASSSLVYFAAQSAKNKGKPPFGRFSSDCRKSLSLRASPRREASALGVLLGMTGVGLSTRCHHPTGWCFFSYSARRNSGFRSRRPSSAAAICPSRASRSPLRVPFSVR